MAVPVTVAKAVQRSVPIQVEVVGNVESSSTVTLKPQISGQLLAAHFREGDFVQAGQLMLTIDPRPLEAQLKQLETQVLRDEAGMAQAEANLTRDRAQEENANVQRERADQLWKNGIISKEQHDQFVTAATTIAATIRADQAAIESSKAQIAVTKAAIETQKVQLAYTRIYAPIGGRTGAMMVKPGNVVTANTTEIATINQVQPVYVTFALPESNLTALRQGTANGMQVTAVAEEGGLPQVGSLAFYENSVDVSTGTVRLRGTFSNGDKKLWPGQFVRVTLRLGDRPNAVLIPSQAVQSGQDGTFVYVVKPDNKVDVRPVTAAQRLGDETIVDQGLEAGETVVTEGTMRLIPGSRVQMRDGRRPGPRGPRGAKRS